MRVGADDQLTGTHQALFGQEGVFNSHVTHVVIIGDGEALGKGAALLTLLCRLDILIGDKVVHHERDLILIKDLGKTVFIKFVDRHGGGNVITQNHVQLRHDQLSRLDRFQSRVCRKDLLCHCHSHCIILFSITWLPAFG